MQASLGSRLSNIAGIGIGGAGVRYSAPEYQIYFEWIFYAALIWGALSILTWLWSIRATILRGFKLIDPSHIIIFGLLVALSGAVWDYLRRTSPLPAQTNQMSARQTLIQERKQPPSYTRPGFSGIELPTQPNYPLHWKWVEWAGYSTDENGYLQARAIRFLGKNVGSKPFNLEQFYMLSEDGKTKVEIIFGNQGLIVAGLEPATAKDLEPIEPDAELYVIAPFRSELTEADFLKEWGAFSLFAVSEGKTYQTKVSDKLVKDILDTTRPPPIPLVKRKATK